MDKVKTSIKVVKSRNRKETLPTIGFAWEDYERFNFLYTSDWLDEFILLEPLYVLYKGMVFNDYFKSIYKGCFSSEFPSIDFSYKELSIWFFFKLMGLEYYENDILTIVYILFKKWYICLKQDNNNINFSDFSRWEPRFKKSVHIFNKNDKIHITNDGLNFVELLFNNNSNIIIQNAKHKYLNSNWIKKEEKKNR